jgi:polyisoprenoid-binding protein YceI
MSAGAGPPVSEIAVYAVVPDQSAVLVEARSNVGPIAFASTALRGEATVSMSGPDLDTAAVLASTIQIPVRSLESGNSLYDSEVCTRLDERRFPLISVELRAAVPLGGGRFSADGDLTIHGSTRRLTGTVSVVLEGEATLVAYGQEVVDLRDFAIRVPTMRMLKIYPDVSVQFRLTAARV